MPLTKSEFDRLREQQRNIERQLNDGPDSHPARITCYGGLHFTASGATEFETRALYEMLRAWYGEATMTEKAKAVIERAIEWRGWRMAVHPAELALNDAVDAYRAEQKQ